jgi:hypothetical protein
MSKYVLESSIPLGFRLSVFDNAEDAAEACDHTAIAIYHVPERNCQDADTLLEKIKWLAACGECVMVRPVTH